MAPRLLCLGISSPQADVMIPSHGSADLRAHPPGLMLSHSGSLVKQGTYLPPWAGGSVGPRQVGVPVGARVEKAEPESGGTGIPRYQGYGELKRPWRPEAIAHVPLHGELTTQSRLNLGCTTVQPNVTSWQGLYSIFLCIFHIQFQSAYG